MQAGVESTARKSGPAHSRCGLRKGRTFIMQNKLFNLHNSICIICFVPSNNRGAGEAPAYQLAGGAPAYQLIGGAAAGCLRSFVGSGEAVEAFVDDAQVGSLEFFCQVAGLDELHGFVGENGVFVQDAADTGVYNPYFFTEPLEVFSAGMACADIDIALWQQGRQSVGKGKVIVTNMEGGVIIYCLYCLPQLVYRLHS